MWVEGAGGASVTDAQGIRYRCSNLGFQYAHGGWCLCVFVEFYMFLVIKRRLVAVYEYLLSLCILSSVADNCP